MDAARSKSALQTGRYAPGQRIDPATLASELKTSPTPVRFALYRLVGEGLVADHARAGLHVPLPTEAALRDLYDWMERLLLMSCELIAARGASRLPTLVLPLAPGDDVAKRTWQLFDAIGHASAHRSLRHAVVQANDRLSPIRRAKQNFIGDDFNELAALQTCWNNADVEALKRALGDYHERRKGMVARISEVLSDGLEQR